MIDYISSKFKEPQCCVITKDVLETCEEFAKKVNETTIYSDCGQNNLKKKYQDNLIGKLSEFGVYSVLNFIKKDVFSVSKPDTNIYQGNEKSWDSDLFIESNNEKINIAVKSQTLSQAKVYGFSGTFQNSITRKDSAIQNKNELVFLCLHFVQNKVIKILVMPPKFIKDISFLPPKDPRLAEYKTCYYVYNNFDTNNLKSWFKKFNVDEKVIYGNSDQQNIYVKVDKEIIQKLNGTDINQAVNSALKSII